jgi:CBS domain containing-hemolysin-like protein
MRVSESPSPYLTEENFKELVETSQRKGPEEEEKHFIHRVFKFSDQTVRHISDPGRRSSPSPGHAGQRGGEI